MKKFTIFLDFDGVLNNDQTTFLIKNYVDGNHTGYDRVNTLVLNRFIEKLFTEWATDTELQIVICSNWRNFYTLQEMKGLLKFYLEDKWIDLIVDTTEVGLFLEREWSRAEQVRNYISKNNIEDYVILDDELSYDEYPEMMMHWIKTNPSYGLREEDILKWKENN